MNASKPALNSGPALSQLPATEMRDLILQAAGEGIFGLDCEGMTTFVNPAAVELLGWNEKELIGQPMHSQLHHTRADGSHYPKETCPVHATFKDGEIHHVSDELFWRKDGSSFVVDYTSTPITRDGKLVGAVVVFTDMSEQKKIESNLMQALNDNKMLLEAAGEGIYGLDCDGLTTFVNPAGTAMLGWEVGDLIGQPMHSLLHHSRPDGSNFPKKQCPIYAAFKDGTVHHVDDEVFWRKDGSSFPVEYTSTPIYKNNKLSGAVVVFSDISERKKTERALQSAHKKIEKMKERLQAENVYLQEEIRDQNDFMYIVGQSSAIKQILQQIELVAPTQSSVLITGESGTGKELIARALHEHSDRNDRPLIRVNCAAIPHELFESEFFGHVKGSFTGAVKDRAGRFQLADGGTIFLDEVGEIPLNLQSKLLRVLQEGQYERVGDEKTRKVDVRLIAATNRDLKIEVKNRTFREDLFFRLNVFPIEAAPLRERIEDIPLLAQHFIGTICNKLNRPEPRMTKANVKQLQSYSWQGNIRELQNVIERAIILSKGKSLQFNLPADKLESIPVPRSVKLDENLTQLPYTEIERIARDRENIMLALELANNKISGANGAAEILGIKPTTLASRIKNMNIQG